MFQISIWYNMILNFKSLQGLLRYAETDLTDSWSKGMQIVIECKTFVDCFHGALSVCSPFAFS